MASTRLLYELQEIDLGLDSRREALDKVVSLLGESQQLQEARVALAESETRLRKLEVEQRDQELQAETLRAKARDLEKRLYGGTVRNPKELQPLHEEVQALRKRQRATEDVALDLMLQVESAQGEREARRRELAAVAQEWHREQERLGQEKTRLEAETAREEERRRRLVQELDGAALRTYEELRLAKQGRAVVGVERGMCLGCRIDLPMSDLRQARLPQVLVHCSNCGRILYVS